MSSLARRSLRTTAAAAGIAALGVGLAGQTFAAPAPPAVPDMPAAPALPDADALSAFEVLERMSPGVPQTPETPSEDGFTMPGVINFETPTVTTAAPAPPALDAFAVPAAPALPAAPGSPTAPALPAVPGAPSMDGILDTDFEFGPGEDAEADNVTSDNEMGAMQALDMANLVMEMAQGAAAGESATQGQQIG